MVADIIWQLYCSRIRDYIIDPEAVENWDFGSVRADW